MSVAQSYAQVPHATLLASSDGSGASPFSALVIVAAVIGLVVVFSLVGSVARPTVVVVEKPLNLVGSAIGIVVIAIALGIIYFTFIAPGSGPV
jgi:hypothetical protein